MSLGPACIEHFQRSTGLFHVGVLQPPQVDLNIFKTTPLCLPFSVLNNSTPNSPAVQIRNTRLILEASFCLTVHVQSDTNFFPLLPKYFSAVSLFSYPLPPSWLRFSLFPVPIAAKASCCHYCLWLPDPPYSLCGSQVCL